MTLPNEDKKKGEEDRRRLLSFRALYNLLPWGFMTPWAASALRCLDILDERERNEATSDRNNGNPAGAARDDRVDNNNDELMAVAGPSNSANAESNNNNLTDSANSETFDLATELLRQMGLIGRSFLRRRNPLSTSRSDPSTSQQEPKDDNNDRLMAVAGPSNSRNSESNNSNPINSGNSNPSGSTRAVLHTRKFIRPSLSQTTNLPSTSRSNLSSFQQNSLRVPNSPVSAEVIDNNNDTLMAVAGPSNSLNTDPNNTNSINSGNAGALNRTSAGSNSLGFTRPSLSHSTNLPSTSRSAPSSFQGVFRIPNPPAPVGNHLCSVCGELTNFKHSGVYCCNACKKFFNLVTDKNTTLECTKQESCVIDVERRNDCRYCRLKKCKAAGMTRPRTDMKREHVRQAENSTRRINIEDMSESPHIEEGDRNGSDTINNSQSDEPAAKIMVVDTSSEENSEDRENDENKDPNF